MSVSSSLPHFTAGPGCIKIFCLRTRWKKTVKKKIRVHKNGSLYMCSQFLTFNEITDPGAQVIISPVFSIYVSLDFYMSLSCTVPVYVCVFINRWMSLLSIVCGCWFVFSCELSDCSFPSCTNLLRFKPRKRLPSLGDVALWFWTRKRIGRSSHN